MDKNHFSQTYSTENAKLFGILSNNEVVQYTLCNKNGGEISVINYGATITSLKIPVSTEEKLEKYDELILLFPGNKEPVISPSQRSLFWCHCGTLCWKNRQWFICVKW
jgi:hypothetical protein